MLESAAASAIVDGFDNHHHHVGETKPYKITTEEKLQRFGIKRGHRGGGNWWKFHKLSNRHGWLHNRSLYVRIKLYSSSSCRNMIQKNIIRQDSASYKKSALINFITVRETGASGGGNRRERNCWCFRKRNSRHKTTQGGKVHRISLVL